MGVPRLQTFGTFWSKFKDLWFPSMGIPQNFKVDGLILVYFMENPDVFGYTGIPPFQETSKYELSDVLRGVMFVFLR